MSKNNPSFVKNIRENPRLLRPEMYQDSFFIECIGVDNFKIYPFYDVFK